MTDSDARIGANLQSLRGGTSQASIASSMKELGWKWTQPTVAAVEKGERSLKLAEAVDLCAILGVQLGDLLPPDRHVTRTEIVRTWTGVRRQIEEAHGSLRSLASQMNRLATLVEANPEAAGELWGDGKDDWRDWVEWDTNGYKMFASLVVEVASEERRANLADALAKVTGSVVLQAGKDTDGAPAHPAE